MDGKTANNRGLITTQSIVMYKGKKYMVGEKPSDKDWCNLYEMDNVTLAFKHVDCSAKAQDRGDISVF